MRQKLPKDQKFFTSNGMRGLASAGQRLQIHHQPGHLTAPLTSEGVSPPPALRRGLLRASHGAARRAVPATWPPLCLLPERNVGSFLLCFVFMYLFILNTYTLMLQWQKMVKCGVAQTCQVAPGKFCTRGLKKKQETFSFLVVQGRSMRVKTDESIPLLCRQLKEINPVL